MRRLAVLFGLLLAGCAGGTDTGVFEPGAAGSAAQRAPVQRSAQAPRQSAGASQDLSKLEHYRHPAAQAMLQATLRDLLAAAGSDISGLPQQVSILDQPGYNAALQSNRLYVTRGMLALMNDRSELAAALAHELSHAIARHPEQRALARRRAVSETVDAARTFRDPEFTRQIVDAQRASLAAFSRDQEHEADRIAIALVAKAGYDPHGAVRMLHSLERITGLYRSLAGLGANRGVSTLASHPSTPERIALVQAQAAALGVAGPGVSGGRSDRAQYSERAQYLAAIEGVRFGESGQGGFLRGRVFAHHGRNIAITMPPGFVPTTTPQGVIGVRRGGTAFALFAAARQSQADDPQGALQEAIGKMNVSARVEPLAGRQGALAFADAPNLRRRIAIVVQGGRPYTLMMYARQPYAGLDRDFRAAVAAIRSLSARDLEIARPWRIVSVTASGPGAIAQYARQAGDVDFGVPTLLALNGLRSAADVRAGMQLKVLMREDQPLPVAQAALAVAE